MGRTTQRIEGIQTLVDYFNSIGTVPTSKEYFKRDDIPFSYTELRRLYYGYDRAVRLVRREYPDVGTKPASAAEALAALKPDNDE